jgi:L-seryl-tRNA(Ser) seleniumtransferase
VPGLKLDVDADPNGNPFSRARLTPDLATTGQTAASLTTALAAGTPTIVARAHHTDEGYIHLDAIELTDDEIELACRKVREILTRQ